MACSLAKQLGYPPRSPINLCPSKMTAYMYAQIIHHAALTALFMLVYIYVMNAVLCHFLHCSFIMWLRSIWLSTYSVCIWLCTTTYIYTLAFHTSLIWLCPMMNMTCIMLRSIQLLLFHNIWPRSHMAAFILNMNIYLRSIQQLLFHNVWPRSYMTAFILNMNIYLRSIQQLWSWIGYSSLLPSSHFMRNHPIHNNLSIL